MSKLSEVQRAQKEYLEALKNIEHPKPEKISIQFSEHGFVEYLPMSDMVYIGDSNGLNYIKFTPDDIPMLLEALHNLFDD